MLQVERPIDPPTDDEYYNAMEREAEVRAIVYRCVSDDPEDDTTVSEYRVGNFETKEGFEDEDWNSLREDEKLSVLGYSKDEQSENDYVIEVDYIC